MSDAILKRLYFGTDAGSFSSATALYKAANKVDPSITLSQVQLFLKSNPSSVYNLKEPGRKLIPKDTVLNHVEVSDINATWFIDTAYLKHSLGNMKYLICQIDAMSKYAHVACFRQLNAANALKAFKSFLQDAGNPKLISLVTDDGKLF